LGNHFLLLEEPSPFKGVQNRRGLQPGPQGLDGAEHPVGEGLCLIGDVRGEDENEQNKDAHHEARHHERGQPAGHLVALSEPFDEWVQEIGQEVHGRKRNEDATHLVQGPKQKE
jgi:hypothetical protein